MGFRICRKCGQAYDANVWEECPHCARKDFERRKKEREETYDVFSAHQFR